MTDPKAAERMARKRQREKDAGLVRVLVTIPVDRVDEIRAIAAQMREQAQAKQA